MISKDSSNIKLSYKIIIVLWLYEKTVVNISLVTCDGVFKLDLYLTVMKCHNVLAPQ